MYFFASKYVRMQVNIYDIYVTIVCTSTIVKTQNGVRLWCVNTTVLNFGGFCPWQSKLNDHYSYTRTCLTVTCGSLWYLALHGVASHGFRDCPAASPSSSWPWSPMPCSTEVKARCAQYSILYLVVFPSFIFLKNHSRSILWSFPHCFE